MKNKMFRNLIIFGFLVSFLSSCSVVGGIFKAGIGVGIFLVVAIVAIILFFVFRGRNRG
jgi:hypothetical protein